MSTSSKPLRDAFRRGGWLPASDADLQAWLKKLTQHELYSSDGEQLIPGVQAFKTFIETNADAYMGFNRMFAGEQDQVRIARLDPAC